MSDCWSPYILKQGMSWNHLERAGTIFNKMELPGITCSKMDSATNWPPPPPPKKNKKKRRSSQELYLPYYCPIYRIHPQGNILLKITLQLPIRVYYNCLVHVIIAHNHVPFFKIFSNFVHFCPNFPIFCPFLHFFWKISRMPLLSRIDPAYCHMELYLRCQQGVPDPALLYIAK